MPALEVKHIVQQCSIITFEFLLNCYTSLVEDSSPGWSVWHADLQKSTKVHIPEHTICFNH